MFNFDDYFIFPKMNTIDNVLIKGKKVLIRVDFNVPLDEELNIIDDTRITAALPTIKKVINNGGIAIIISHLGRPKQGYEKKFSLKNVVGRLSELTNTVVSFCCDCIGEEAVASVEKMKLGEILVLENLRFYHEEVAGDIHFAKQLASLADIYINDAFGTAHRAHASTAIIAQFFPRKKYLGYLLIKELRFLEKALKKPKRPFTAIIGGAKITGKIDVIRSLFEKVDNLIIGGGMSYTFIKAMGGRVGKSLIEQEKVELALQLIDEAQKKGVNLFLPIDSINANVFNNNAIVKTSNIFKIDDNFMGLDIGSKSIEKFCKIIQQSKTIIWNGPMGVFEMSNFEKGTKKIGESICLATANNSFSLVGGGDSVSALKKYNLQNKVSYISTGGGAMLEYIEGKRLPGIVAILD